MRTNRRLFHICLLATILLRAPADSALATTFFVNIANPSPAPPYTNWAGAAVNIQDAIDASTNGDLIVVTNGDYNTGGRIVFGSMTNRVVVNKAVTVQSVNGPAFTVIEGSPVIGSSAVRCVYLTNYAVINGFTLTNGATLNTGDAYQEESGGGLFCCTNSIATNCVLVNNSAYNFGGGAFGGGSSFATVFGDLSGCSLIQNSAYWGGGVLEVRVSNSLLMSNTASFYGGGAAEAVLTNCIVAQNVSDDLGGGAYSSSLYGCLVISNQSGGDGGVSLNGWALPRVFNCTIVANNAFSGAGGINGYGNTINSCIIYYNTVSTGSSSNYASGSSFFNCCTLPDPVSDLITSTTTNEPGFVDYLNGNYRLASNSPCINAGSPNPTFATDLDGNPRVVDQLVDIGAYEYQIAGSILPAFWAQQYGLSEDGTIDTDGDGMDNFDEYIAGTNPTNAASVLKMLSVSSSVSGTTVKWQSVSQKIYFLQRSSNLAGSPVFSSIRSNLSTFNTTSSFTDTNAVGTGPYFYRVGVQVPP